jgi:hypothetical protein
LADGEKNPDLIPDEVALRTLFMALAIPPNPNPSQVARLRAQAGRMALDENDFGILVQELGRFHGMAKALNERVAGLRESGRLNPTPAAVARIVDADRELPTWQGENFFETIVLLVRDRTGRRRARRNRPVKGRAGGG